MSRTLRAGPVALALLLLVLAAADARAGTLARSRGVFDACDGLTLFVVVVGAVVVASSRERERHAGSRPGSPHARAGTSRYDFHFRSDPKDPDIEHDNRLALEARARRLRRKKVHELPALAELRERDPAFSLPLFLDFAVLLHDRLQHARRAGRLSDVRGWVSPAALDALEEAPTGKTRARILDSLVASAQLVSVDRHHGRDRLAVRFEGSAPSGQDETDAAELWTFERAAGVRSLPPERIASFGCPSCGAKDPLGPDGTCAACGVIVAAGAHAWELARIEPDDDDGADDADDPKLLWARDPLGRWRKEFRSEPVVHVADGRPRTIIDARLKEARHDFLARYPDFTFIEFDQRFVPSRFLHLHRAWAKGDLEAARPYETDSLFETHRYWIERFRRHGIKAHLREEEVTNVETVKIERDAFFDAITVRVHARVVEYLTRDHALVGGNLHHAVPLNEYWTFIRSSGFDPKRSEPEPGKCPSCGAPVEVTVSGTCDRCGNKITSGAFGWLLCQIVQDTAYEG